MVKATRFVLPVLMFLIMGLASCPLKRPGEDGRTHVRSAQQEMINKARATLDSGNYEASRAEAAKFIEAHPSSLLCADAQYIIALSYLREGREEDARKELDRLLKNFPSGPNNAEAAATLRTLEARRLHEIAAIRAEQQRIALERARRAEEATQDIRIMAAKERVYVVLDLLHNVVMIKMGNATLYAFPCATGKVKGYLTTVGKPHKFSTPIGRHKIIQKTEKPKWVRPNWYWLERGEEVPEGMTEVERAVEGKLGEYKINIGDAFFFHGFIGRVTPGKYTHGCVRLNDDHLEIMYNIVEIGTEVYIF